MPLAVSHVDKQEGEVSLLDGAGAAFYTQKKKLSATDKNPVGNSGSDDVLVKLFSVELFRFKPDKDAREEIICKQCFGFVAAPQGYTTNL